MEDFGKLKQVDPRSIWPNEATDFTPWLAKNINALGEKLGMELELKQEEAEVGDFSLDLLAKDLGTGHLVVIENQLSHTDHDHLGKLLTYAGGFNAQVVIWIAKSLREEHRQALEWLNQVTGPDVHFFGVVIEVIQIDSSNPAYNFKPIVFPNEWQKLKRATSNTGVSSRGKAYQQFFQKLIDTLREKHHFTGARKAQPQSWYCFSSGISSIVYSASFAHGGRIRTEIYIDTGDKNENENIFDNLKKEREKIEEEFKESLSWEKLDNKRASRVALYRQGSIDSGHEGLEEIKEWIIESLLIFKKVFRKRVQKLFE